VFVFPRGLVGFPTEVVVARSSLVLLFCVLALAVSCGGKGDGDTTTATATDTDTATAVAETDDDGDGYSVKAGDCDDAGAASRLRQLATEMAGQLRRLFLGPHPQRS
jgi:hypothetical protein